MALVFSVDSDPDHTNLITECFRVTLEDGLYQVKTPILAMPTFSKLLQRVLEMRGVEAPMTKILVVNIVEQEGCVEILMMSMNSIAKMMDGVTDEMERILLLALMEGRDFILRPKDGVLTTVGLPVPSTSNLDITRSPPISKLEL